jgi:hypothetical protein
VCVCVCVCVVTGNSPSSVYLADAVCIIPDRARTPSHSHIHIHTYPHCHTRSPHHAVHIHPPPSPPSTITPHVRWQSTSSSSSYSITTSAHSKLPGWEPVCTFASCACAPRTLRAQTHPTRASASHSEPKTIRLSLIRLDGDHEVHVAMCVMSCSHLSCNSPYPARSQQPCTHTHTHTHTEREREIEGGARERKRELHQLDPPTDTTSLGRRELIYSVSPKVG